eukprot:1442757-Amphidinium_carterae.1
MEEREVEPPEAEGKCQGGNIKCEVCYEFGVWSEFAFAEVSDDLDWRPANVYAPKLMEVVALVKRVYGGNTRMEAPKQVNRGKVVLACYKCWIRATGMKGYEYEDGRVSRKFRNMAQKTKQSECDRKTRQWLKWRVQGKLKVSPDEMLRLSMKTRTPGQLQ